MISKGSNCLIYTLDADLIGKLIMNGHSLHYVSDIENLLKEIKEQNPDLIILDLIRSVDLSAINSLMHVNNHVIIRGEVDLSSIEVEVMKNIVLLPSGISNDSILERVTHFYEYESIAAEKPVKVLIIEDNIDIIEMYELALQSKGYEVTRALDGLTGVTKAVTLRPDVIILDIMMPNMDGFEVLQALRNNTSLRSLIITNSNLEGVNEEKKVKELGSDYFLRKSEYTPLDVVGFIETILQSRHAS
ncbi:MAG: hypothetical protein HHAS10_05730 [Candidatus Altimarinota bacterium]